MPELKKFPVFGDHGRIGTLTAPARFLDNRTEKTVQLDGGGEISVPAEALAVQQDGSFYLRDSSKVERGDPESHAEPAMAPRTPDANQEIPPVAANGKPEASNAARSPDDRLFRDGYTIERIKVERLIPEPVAQRQEGDTLVLPVVEEVLVVEKRLMLREEIRITRKRERVEEVRTIDSSTR